MAYSNTGNNEHLPLSSDFLTRTNILRPIHDHEMSTTRYEYHGDSDVSRLAQSLTLGRSLKTAPNRLLKSAMAEALSGWDANDVGSRGIPTQEVVELYRR